MSGHLERVNKGCRHEKCYGVNNNLVQLKTKIKKHQDHQTIQLHKGDKRYSTQTKGFLYHQLCILPMGMIAFDYVLDTIRLHPKITQPALLSTFFMNICKAFLKSKHLVSEKTYYLILLFCFRIFVPMTIFDNGITYT